MYIHPILCSVIFKYLEFKDKHAFKRICAYTNKIQITDLYDVQRKYLRKLDDKILSNYKYVKRLNASNNKNITNINHMTKLKELDASGGCGIDDKGISNLNLEKLDICNNHKITNVNHMSNLQELSDDDYE